jgi:phage gpG-like protein
MQLRVEAVGDTLVKRHLLAMADRTDDASPAMGSIIESLYDAARQQFDTAGAAGGTPWPANADTTVERKSREGLDPRVLHATLDLRESLTGPGGANIAIAQADGVIFGTTVEHARYLRERYPMVRVDAREKRDWVKAVQKWIIDGDASRGGILGGIV